MYVVAYGHRDGHLLGACNKTTFSLVVLMIYHYRYRYNYASPDFDDRFIFEMKMKLRKVSTISFPKMQIEKSNLNLATLPHELHSDIHTTHTHILSKFNNNM